MPATIALDSQQIGVIRDLMRPWRERLGAACLDPNVTSYPPGASAGGAKRWSPDVLQSLLADSTVAIDSLAGAVQVATPKCARSATTIRLAYAPPIIAGDTGSIGVVMSHLDSHGAADTSMFIYRLVRTKGRWNVPGWIADSEVTHSYVKGDGCYRFSHADFVAGIRIDMVLVQAERKLIGRSWRSTPEYQLRPPSKQVGLGALYPGQGGSWFVTHDSLHLEWTSVNNEVSVDLLVKGDSLRGVMQWTTDAITPDPPHVQVVGWRVACPRQ